eukprot:427617-Prymnesium_polylepis.1
MALPAIAAHHGSPVCSCTATIACSVTSSGRVSSSPAPVTMPRRLPVAGRTGAHAARAEGSRPRNRRAASSIAAQDMCSFEESDGRFAFGTWPENKNRAGPWPMADDVASGGI